MMDFFLEKLESIKEETIKTLPAKSNSVRNSSETYDSVEVKDILSSNNLLQGNYQLSEECVSNSSVFTKLSYVRYTANSAPC